MLPEGRYSAEYLSHKWGQTSNAKPQLGVCVRLFGHDGRRLGSYIWRGYLTPDAAEICRRTMRELGWTGPGLEEGLGTQKSVTATVKHEEYEGHWQAVVAFLGSDDYIPMAQEMSEQTRAAALAALAAAGDPQDGDDIPY